MLKHRAGRAVPQWKISKGLSLGIVKATTVEKMGSIGREEGIGAVAVATVVRY